MPIGSYDMLVKVRHGQKIYQAQVSVDENNATIILAEQDQGIAPGQFAVLYDGQRCVGAGKIL
jgi:tRNA-specific 2-thiouridylase